MTEPTDAELDELRQANSGKLNFVTLSEFRTIARAVLAKWGTLRAEKIVIPTDTMEQEFQKHYRRGYEAVKKAATPQPAGAQQPGTAYAELPSYEHQRAIMEAERNASLDEYSRIVLLTSTESRIYERAFTNGWNRRASHGQAQALAAPQQKAASVDLKTMELAESVGLIGPASRTHDLHAAIQRFHDLICANATIKAAQMAAEAISEAAPQQGDVQEPVAWYVTGCGRLLDEYEAEAEARRIGGTARAMPLYTVPQPSPTSQGDALDAARLDWLESQSQVNIERVRYLGADTSIYEVTPFNSTDYNGETLRKAIDAARKQGANHD